MKHCPNCGAKFLTEVWPRKCQACGAESYRNPVPVAVAIIPVLNPKGGRPGVLIVQRGIEPQFGKWALPGGFMEWAEDIEDTLGREPNEEAYVYPDTTNAKIILTRNIHGKLLIFGVTNPVRLPPEAITKFVPNEETLAIAVANTPQELCYPTHTEALRKFFESWYSLGIPGLSL